MYYYKDHLYKVFQVELLKNKTNKKQYEELVNMNTIKYNFEYEKKIRVCFIGAGRHVFNNLLPTIKYAPIDLVGICDVVEEKAAACARLFGANNYYTDYKVMLEKEKPDAVFIITTYYPDGRIRATDIAMDALEAGCHVWMEKPTAASTEEVHMLIEASTRNKRYVLTGMKKAFTPAIDKVKDIISSPEFGRPASIYMKYPEYMPPFEDRKDLPKMFALLDHVYHFGAVLNHLMGKIAHFSYEWEPFNGGSVTSMRFASGAIGTLHMAHGISGSSPLERYEVVGEGANIVVDNGVKVSYYRKSKRPLYGRSISYMVGTETAPLFWEPEFSLGSMYNESIFLEGYIQEVLYFCECVLNSTPPQKGNLEVSLEIAKLFDAYRSTPSGKIALLN